MAEVGSVKYGVEIDRGATNKNISETESTLTSAFEKLSGNLGKIVAGIFAAAAVKKAVDGFVSLTKQAFNSVAQFEQLAGGVETLFGAGGKSIEEYAKSVGKSVDEVKGEYDGLMKAQETVMENAKQGYKTAGMSANEYMQTVTSFSASLIQSLDGDTAKAAKVADQAIVDMSDNANKMGTDIASIQNAYQGFAKQNYTMLDNLKLGYGGTKTEMERLIADANKVKEANGEMANLTIESFADVTEAIHIIQTEMGITGTTAKEAATTIEGSMNSAKAAWDNFLNGSGSAEELADAWLTVAEVTVTNLSEIVPRLLETLPALAAGIIERVPEFVSTVVPSIIEGITGLFESDGKPALLDSGTAMLGKFIEGIANKAPELMTKLTELLGNILTKLIEKAPTWLAQGQEFVLKVVNGILEKMPQLLTTIGTVLTNVLQKLLESLPKFMENGANFVLRLIHGITQRLPEIVRTMGTLIARLITTIVQNLPKILQKGIEIVGRLVAGLIQAVPKIVSAIPKLVRAILDGFKDTDWGGLGRDIISGIANGLSNAGGLIVDAARNAARSALDAAKSWLGISSPSKVFRDQVGKMIPAGVAVGIDDNIEAVDDSMADLSNRLTMDISAPDISSMASDIGASISASASTQINVPVVIDGREVARATAWYTNEQLAWEAR